MILPLLPCAFRRRLRRRSRGSSGPLAEILRQPVTIAALFAGVFGYSTMVFIMTATPLAMKFCGFGIGETADVLSVHILGMFAPSFVTGHIIRRIGERRVLLAGAASLIATRGDRDCRASTSCISGSRWCCSASAGTSCSSAAPAC